MSGNRSISSTNASDFVVTIAIGSTIANIMLDSNGVIGLVALALLVGIQYVTILISERVLPCASTSRDSRCCSCIGAESWTR